MFVLRSVATGFVALSMTACAVGPDHQAPAAGLARDYTARTMPAPAAAMTDAELARWWESLGDPLLAHYVTLALSQNLELAQVAARLSQARAALGAADAALLPSIEVSASAARARQSLETPTGRLLEPAPGYERTGSAYEANLAAGWELDLFGGLRRSREAAQALYHAARADLVAARLAVAAQTADTYIGVRGLQARLDLARRQVQVREDLVHKVGRLYDKGAAAELQLRQAEGELAQLQASVPVLQAGLEAALNALDIMVGAQPGSHRAAMAAPAPIPDAPVLARLGTPADLLRRRPDLIAAERRVAVANARVGAAMAEYYPQVSLGALVGSATTVSSGRLFGDGASQASALLGLRWRLFDFGRIDAQVGQMQGAKAESLAAYRMAVLRAAEDVENALSAMLGQQRRLAALERSEAALARARSASFAAWQRGGGSLIEVLRADELLLRSADARIQARAELARAAVASYRALGGGWDGADGNAAQRLSAY